MIRTSSMSISLKEFFFVFTKVQDRILLHLSLEQEPTFKTRRQIEFLYGEKKERSSLKAQCDLDDK